MKTVKDSKGKEYKQTESGTCYHIDTPEQVINILENALSSHRERRLKFHYGDAKTGRDWNEEHGTTGYIGRSTGSIKIPLLIATSRSSGGGGILDHCILKISDTKTKKVLYVHPLYKKPVVEIIPSDMTEYSYNTIINGELYGRHRTLKDANRVKYIIEGV